MLRSVHASVYDKMNRKRQKNVRCRILKFPANKASERLQQVDKREIELATDGSAPVPHGTVGVPGYIRVRHLGIAVYMST